MRNFGFVADITQAPDIHLDDIINGFEKFTLELTPKHVKSCTCHIITSKPTVHIKNERIFTGPLELHSFDESSWLTDWYYLIPGQTVLKWMEYAAMVGPGPLVLRPGDSMFPDFNSRLVIMLSDDSYELSVNLQHCLYTLYHDEGARKLFSKLAKGCFLEQRKKVQNMSSIQV